MTEEKAKKVVKKLYKKVERQHPDAAESTKAWYALAEWFKKKGLMEEYLNSDTGLGYVEFIVMRLNDYFQYRSSIDVLTMFSTKFDDPYPQYNEDEGELL